MLDNEAESHRLRGVDDASDRPKRVLNLKTSINWKKQIKKRIFILSWIRTYNKDTAIGDFIAGITLGLTIIPQAIAYAALAGLPSQYGLYSAFMGKLVYAVMHSTYSVLLWVDPSSTYFVFFFVWRFLNLRILRYHKRSVNWTHFVDVATYITVYTRQTTAICGRLNIPSWVHWAADGRSEIRYERAHINGVHTDKMMFSKGFVVDFISVPVTNAFTSATSLIIIGAQLKNLLGISYSSKGFADSLYNLFIYIGDSQLWDGVLGLVCCIFLLLLRVFVKSKKLQFTNSEHFCYHLSSNWKMPSSNRRQISQKFSTNPFGIWVKREMFWLL